MPPTYQGQVPFVIICELSGTLYNCPPEGEIRLRRKESLNRSIQGDYGLKTQSFRKRRTHARVRENSGLCVNRSLCHILFVNLFYKTWAEQGLQFLYG